MPPSLAEALQDFPHLASPAALAITDTNGKFELPPHLAYLNKELVEVGMGLTDRLAVNLAFQHGKSWLSSHYYPAWHLLLFPETRILLAAHEERYAATFGSKVKDVIERWGRPLGVTLKQDTQAKDEWVISQHGGGMVCKGMHGSLQGRPADLLLLDDLIKDAEQALSKVYLEKMWDWFATVAFSRLGPTAPIVNVGTRWGKLDLFGRIDAEAKKSGEKWKWVKFKAIAEENDILGRKPGQALWPQRVPLARLELIRAQRGRWFQPCWQQNVDSEEGAHFMPRLWPHYRNVGDAYALYEAKADASPRKLLLTTELVIFASMDWAWSEKQAADYTAIVVFGLTPSGSVLILDVVNVRVPPQGLAPLLDRVCRQHRPSVVVVEVGHPTLAQEYLKFPAIPEVRWMKPENKSKLMRALPAIVMGDNRRIYLPKEAPWLEDYIVQLGSFTGIADEHDDMVDATAWGCQLAQGLRGRTSRLEAEGPVVLTPGRNEGWF